MATNFLSRPEGRIAYDVTGDGPLVVCVPGMGVVRSVFRSTVAPLVAAGYRVATFDIRGHGDSDDSFSSYDDEALASDLLALIDHLGGGSALVLGSSMGAGAGVIAAAQAPEKIAGLGLLGPFVRQPAVNAAKTLMMRVMLTKPWGPAAWRTYHRSCYPGRKPADFADYEQAIDASLRRGDHWRSFVKTTHTSHDPAEAATARVTAPVLVVMGARDPDWPDATAEARWAAERLNGELLIVPDGGHYPMAEYPELVNPALLAFAELVFGGIRA
ncbi:MAG TPA: alpha/beta hydrolase [Conexibacter sp.]|jgi:pimeloyl-ACP methyl ester carboxylesterase